MSAALCKESRAWKLLGGLWMYSEKIATRTQVTLGLGQTDLASELIEVKLYRKAKPKIYAMSDNVMEAQNWATEIDAAVRVLTGQEYGFFDLCRSAGNHALGDQVLGTRVLWALRVIEGGAKKTPRKHPRLIVLDQK